MEIIETHLPGLLLIKPDVFGDNRGYFFESHNKLKFSRSGLELDFVQDNISKSVQNTVRGLHYQVSPMAQGKLCQVIVGEVLDVAVDIRKESETYGRHFAQILSEENHYQLYIPPGFAHGFSVLSPEAVFHYKCTNYYSKEHERSILFNDPDLDIEWRVSDPVISEKDLSAPLFKHL